MMCVLTAIGVLILAVAAFWAAIAALFWRDVQAVFDRDPAATSFLEVLLTYSGVHALIFYRIARSLRRLDMPFFSRVISQMGKFFTGIEIHPGAQIGKDLFIDHGMGLVIGETTIIGSGVTLYQGVTLGGTGKEKGKRHPTIGRNVVVGAGAKVLGNIMVGDNSYVGANAVVIRDVPANATVVGVPARITKQEGRKMDVALDHIHMLDPVRQAMEDLEKRIKKLEKDQG